MRNYKKEYENYHSRPEQKIRRAARNAARKRFSNADSTLDVHHKDNDPLNNDLNNLSLVTQRYNRKEPRLREKKLKALQAKLTAALRQTEGKFIKQGPGGMSRYAAKELAKIRDKIRKLEKKAGKTKEILKLKMTLNDMGYQENVQERTMNLKTIGRDLEKFAKTDRGGQPIDRDADKDKKDMIKVAAMLKKGDKSTALKYAKKLDNHRRLKHFGISLTPQQYILDLLGENVQEGSTDPQELAKEIMWGQSSKNVDSKVLSREQKKSMREIAKFMNRLRNPDWISKFNEIYNKRSDKLVQQRLQSAVKRVGFSSGLVKKLFKEDMGSVTGPHIAGTGDDNTVHTKPKKKKLKKRVSLIKGMSHYRK